jgi:ParB family chromosome partitioning protein
MKEIGQLHAIKVNPEMKLRAGLHRVEAAKILGWDEIEGDIVDVDPLRQELIEIDENLIRSELHFLERGEFLRRRKEIYEILYPDARRGGDKKSIEYKEKKDKAELLVSMRQKSSSSRKKP